MPTQGKPPATTVAEVLARRGSLVVPLKLFGQIFHVYQKTLDEWVERGLPMAKDPDGGKGRAVDLLEGCQWVKNYLQRLAKSAETPLDKLNEARTNEAERRTEKLTLELAVRRGELASTTLLEKAYRHLVTFLRGRALSWARKLAVAIDAKNPTRVERILDREIRRVLEEMARDEGDLLTTELAAAQRRVKNSLPRIGVRGRRPNSEMDDDDGDDEPASA